MTKKRPISKGKLKFLRVSNKNVFHKLKRIYDPMHGSNEKTSAKNPPEKKPSALDSIYNFL